MTITRGVLAQSPEPEARDNVNPDRIGIWKCWFLRRGENRSTRRKTSRSKDENQQQTQVCPFYPKDINKLSDRFRLPLKARHTPSL